jgi:MFS transporter, DHA2 family, multidrug resistance protein
VPVMLLLLAVGPRFLPEYRDPDPGRFDLPSAGLSLVAILAVVFGIKRIAEHGGVDATALGALALGIAVGFVFIRRQRRIPDPLVPLAMFARPAFSMALLGNSFGIFLVGGTFLFITQYLQLVAELSPLTAGLWLLPSAGAFVAGSMLAPLLARRFRAGLLMAAGLLISAAGLLFLTTSVDAAGGFADLIAASAAIDFGIAIAVTLGTDLIVGTAPSERAGVASGLSETGAELGGAFGIALLGSIGAAVYRAQFEGAVALPPQVAESAGDSLASAAAVSERLPADVLAAAEAAFVSGFQTIAALSAALALLVAATLIAVFRRERLPG